ncbi:hypothetical protein MOQ72_14700 [Saccharopolyspora sp. K220]|uniref:hypothetical protein n=1 Tax=Saccharopolyspora soli TaxID=2926618 RepID=UPI001F59C07A|nr:hypothetical protein [Saccharopolyspora soli]MCI2418687.1 hypothetical protein [Saccharopolyspora soli]
MTGVVWISVAAVLLVALGLFPLRGGNGQHAHAGPGTVSVWQLRESILAAQEQEAIVWPTEDPDRGRHHMRNVDMLCHRLATVILEHGAVRSPIRLDVCPPRINIALG